MRALVVGEDFALGRAREGDRRRAARARGRGRDRPAAARARAAREDQLGAASTPPPGDAPPPGGDTCGVSVMVSPADLRRTLGRFCTGVTVVTTERDGEIHAMTANAFTSVSLDPPLVLVSIDHRAKMHRLLPDTRRFGVSVLACDQERTAWHFAGRPLAEPGDLFVHGRRGAARARRDRPRRLQPARLPRGRRPHALLGHVEHLDSRPGEPLLFHRGVFGRVSPHEADLEQTWGW